MNAHSGIGSAMLWMTMILAASYMTDATAASTCKLHVRTLEPSGDRPAPARVYLTDANGALQVPEGVIVYHKGREHHFVTTGEFRIELPPGTYTLQVERGLEFHPWTTSLDLHDRPSLDVDARPARWIAMNRLDWYSADLHNHRKIEEMPALLLAEDLNLAPTLTDWIWEDKPISRPPQTGEPIRRVDSTHVFSALDKEVERLEWGPGAVDLLALRSIIPFDGDRLSPPNDSFCGLAHKQGGYVDAEKIVWRDGAALAALGQLDFAGIVHNHFNRHGVELETDPWGMIPKERPEYDTPAGMPLWSMDVYYRLLNCGFRLAVSAGSASGVKDSPLGYNRVYVRLDGSFSYGRWFQALKAGRSFGTNGPILFLRVNDQDPGAVLKFPQGNKKPLKIRAEASSLGVLDRLEIVFKGKVVKSVGGPGQNGKLAADLEMSAQESGWVAARCFERPTAAVRFAQTSPVYIEIGSMSPVVAADAKYFVDLIGSEMTFYRNETRFRKPDDRAAMLSFFERARRVYEKLR
jgi:hypothetical protein